MYEEQSEEGAKREARLSVWLAANGVPTPAPLPRRDGAHIGAIGVGGAGKPAALFPFVAGEMSCQRGVTSARAARVGETLARIHSLHPPESWPSRFDVAGLRERLARVAADQTYGPLAPGLRAKLDEAWDQRDPTAPRGLVHGDVFRDNVLWEGDELRALLDFESASEGSFAYDLAVTVLAFGFSDRFEPAIVRGLFSGYEAVRPIDGAERQAIFSEARVGALRFTITRITDYAMRAGAALAQKDYRRFVARLDALDAMGGRGFAALAGW